MRKKKQQAQVAVSTADYPMQLPEESAIGSVKTVVKTASIFNMPTEIQMDAELEYLLEKIDSEDYP